jgi:hypothetical protein
MARIGDVLEMYPAAPVNNDEVLLKFNDPHLAKQFRHWWHGEGAYLFEKYLDRGHDESAAQASLREILPWAERWVQHMNSQMVGSLYPAINDATIRRAKDALGD